MLWKSLVTAGLVVATASPLWGMEFQPLGFESISMGGAGVASAKGSMAGYYNPALLGCCRYDAEIGFGVGVGVRDHNLAENVDKLAEDYQLSDTLERIARNAPDNGTNSQSDRNNILKAQATLLELSRGDNGLSLLPGVSLGVQLKRFGLGLYVVSEATVNATVDPDHLSLVVEHEGGHYFYDPAADTYGETSQSAYESTSLEYALDNGLTYLELDGLAMAEVPLSYAHSFPVGTGMLSVGGSFKLMRGTTYFNRISIDTRTGDLNDEFDEADESSNAFGIDIGALLQPPGNDRLAIGLVAKNINSPEFDRVNNTTVTVDPMVRTGVAYSAFDDTLEWAADLDLTQNDTFIPGVDSQYIGGGVNYHPLSWFSIRGGLMLNLADSGDGLVYTAGIGFGLKWLQLDLAAQMSSETIEYDGTKIPQYSKVNVAIVSKW